MANEKEWQQDISNAVDTHTEEIDNHETRITQNENKLGDHEKRIDNIETTSDVGQIATRVQAIEDKNKKQDGAIDELKDKDTLLEQSINANKTLITNEQADRAKAIDGIKNYVDTEKQNYYPLTGGALTQQTICRNVNNDCLRLYGGKTHDSNNKEQGALVIINGKERVFNSGDKPDNANILVTLRTIDLNDVFHDFNVIANGVCNWNGKNIVRSVNGALADTNGEVNYKSKLLEFVYPVGSIYMSIVNKSPANFLGGTWQALNEGRVLIGANSTYTAGETGGEFTHKITVAELPAHNHSASTASAGAHSHTASTNSTGAHTHNYVKSPVSNQVFGAGGFQNKAVESKAVATSSEGAHSHTVSVASNGAHTHSVSINNTGGGNAMNNMQPYLAVYMWKRTA